MSQPQGIDVAYPQGPDYNWRQWRGKISFGMCKATEGLTITDPYFVNNWNAMWELSSTMPRFAYHFFHASDDPAGRPNVSWRPSSRTACCPATTS